MNFKRAFSVPRFCGQSCNSVLAVCLSCARRVPAVCLPCAVVWHQARRPSCQKQTTAQTSKPSTAASTQYLNPTAHCCPYCLLLTYMDFYHTYTLLPYLNLPEPYCLLLLFADFYHAMAYYILLHLGSSGLACNKGVVTLCTRSCAI